MKNNKITLIVLFGKSASGKDTVLKEAMSLFPERFIEPDYWTTRPPRNEKEKYTFIEPQENKKLIDILVEQFKNKDDLFLLQNDNFNNWEYVTAVRGSKISSLDSIVITILPPEATISVLFNQDLANWFNVIPVEVAASDGVRLKRSIERDENYDEVYRRILSDNEDFQKYPVPHFLKIDTEDEELDRKEYWTKLINFIDIFLK